MDCFAVSVAGSIAHGRYDWRRIMLIALFFGGFQGIMPIIGWCASVWFADLIGQFDHWVALIILGIIGGKMVIESFKEEEERDQSHTPYGSVKMLTLLAIATSIDALATGILFVPCGSLIWTGAAVIALGSAVFSTMGCVIGIEFGRRFKLNVNLIGGLILVGIGVKIFVEHVFFS